MKLLVLPLLLLQFLPVPPETRPPPGWKPPPPKPGVLGVCTFMGNSADKDPKGLNVRAAPSPDAPIVGVLPPPEYDKDEEVSTAVAFDVVEARNGWFRIKNAYADSDDWNKPSRRPSGWISGRYLDFTIGTDLAFAEPDPKSRVVATAPKYAQLAYRNPSDCKGNWVKLKVKGREGREVEGWIRGICGPERASCDGRPGDWLPDEKRKK